MMDTPGFDPVSVTGWWPRVQRVCSPQVEAVASAVKPTPSIKIATNTPHVRADDRDMDTNAGVILDGASVEEVGREFSR